MPDYRRNRVPEGTYFFTVNRLDRNSCLLIGEINVLREAVRRSSRFTVKKQVPPGTRLRR